MSTVSAGETSPPTTEGFPTSSMDYNYLEHGKQQQSSNITGNMLPPLSTSASSCCHPTTMSNSSSQIDLYVETASSAMDTSSATICASSPNMYVNAGVLDLCGSGLEKLNRAAPDYVLNTTTLLLDDNCLQRLDNIHTYQCLEKVPYLYILKKNKETNNFTILFKM